MLMELIKRYKKELKDIQLKNYNEIFQSSEYVSKEDKFNWNYIKLLYKMMVPIDIDSIKTDVLDIQNNGIGFYFINNKLYFALDLEMIYLKFPYNDKQKLELTKQVALYLHNTINDIINHISKDLKVIKKRSYYSFSSMFIEVKKNVNTDIMSGSLTTLAYMNSFYFNTTNIPYVSIHYNKGKYIFVITLDYKFFLEYRNCLLFSLTVMKSVISQNNDDLRISMKENNLLLKR